MTEVTGHLAGRIAHAVRGAHAARDGLAVAAALNSIEPGELAAFFHRALDGADAEPIGSGLPASPGAASGEIAVTADDALAAADAGRDVVLVRAETSPDDVLGMQASKGILTARGGLVSHAAVVARGWGIPAVVGAADVHLDAGTVRIGELVLRAGDEITIDGSTGAIYAGRLATTGCEPPPELHTLLAWADCVAAGQVQVRVNADTAGDASHGRSLGALGIGLCRTEHMFLSAERLAVMRRFILSDDPDVESAALAELEAAQVADFEEVLEAMDGLPVTVRLLDPPLHEFLPDLVDLTAREARGELDEAGRAELAAVRRLHETNPMIGTRGVRLGVVRSGVYEMQVRALCTAAADLFGRGRRPEVEIMIPLVVDAEELRIARSWVTGVLDEIGHPELAADVVTVGAMIETPRAALVAAALAAHADFFSFGTNDLTQMTYAFSRDDVEANLLPAYQRLGILPANPFAELDQDGVGALIRIASEAARHAKPDIKLGVCGEHAGHPASAAFLVRLGVDSVSCSPFRVPMARLGVAQALLASGRVHLDDVTFTFDTFDTLDPLDTPDARVRSDCAPPDDASSAGSPTTDDADDVLEADEALLVHVLRIRGFATPDALSASLGTVPVDLLTGLVDLGWVRHIAARDMYALTPAGREHHASLLEALVDDDRRTRLQAHYPPFLALNDDLKRLCTDWQVRDGVPNDHTDIDHDAACVTRLAALADDSDVVVGEMAAAVARLGRYARRLREAVTCVQRGETNRFTGVMCESFHDVWMELHEDLVLLLGIDRVAERSF